LENKKIWCGTWRFNNPDFPDYHGRSGHVKAFKAFHQEDADSEVKVRGYGNLKCPIELFQFIEAHNVKLVASKKRSSGR
jgi:hypothetical protein